MPVSRFSLELNVCMIFMASCCIFTGSAGDKTVYLACIQDTFCSIALSVYTEDNTFG